MCRILKNESMRVKYLAEVNIVLEEPNTNFDGFCVLRYTEII